MGVLAFHFSYKIPFVTDIFPSPGVSELSMFATVGGLLTAVIAFIRRFRTATLVLALTVFSLLSVSLSREDFWELDAGVSARPMVKTALEHMTPEQASGATVFRLRRAYKYQVDFYLHRETEEWSPRTERNSIIFTDYKNSQEIVRLGGECPPYIAFPTVWVCEGKSGEILVPAPARSGQPQ